MNEVKERPIIFNSEMIRAILDGFKTQTRRVIKPQPPEWSEVIGPELCHPIKVDRHGEEYPGEAVYGVYDNFGEWGVRCPYGKPGDRLWVRETHSWVTLAENEFHQDKCKLCRRNKDGYPVHMWYRADDPYIEVPWRPSICMPRWASRINLEVKDIRVKRVQEIRPEDCWDEGIMYRGPGYHIPMLNALDDFSKLWDSINAKRGYSWDSNPWVWVVEIEVDHNEH